MKRAVTFLDFLAWEKASRDTIDFKKAYVDMTGDLVAGLMLSQLIYWHLPNEKGETKLRILKEGKMWMAKTAEEWWDECRIKTRELDRVKKVFAALGLVEMRVWKFSGKPTVHYHLDQERFMDLWQLAVDGELQRDKHAFSKAGRAGKKTREGFHQSVITGLFHESVETDSPIGENVLTDPCNQNHKSVHSSTETPSEITQRSTQETTSAAPGDSLSLLEEEKRRLGVTTLSQSQLIDLARRKGFAPVLAEMRTVIDDMEMARLDTSRKLVIYRAVEAAQKEGTP